MAKQTEPAPIESAREDGKGHWPKGKPRNKTAKDWPAVQKALERLLRSPEYAKDKSDLSTPVRSRTGLARALGMSDRQVRRWLAGEDVPSAETVAAIKKWMRNWPSE
jgi:hypothetical protein